ncbi:MAG: SOS response-associated peptidase, partial [Sphingobacteriales bacterium]
MCAHFESPSALKLTTLIQGVNQLTDRYTTDVWPGRKAPFLVSDTHEPKWVLGAFGLMPFWAKPTHYRHTYNARTETVSTKPTFRQAWKLRQFCAVPAQAFYEPNYETGKVESHHIERMDEEVF